MRFVTPDEIANSFDWKRVATRIAAKANFITSPLDKSFNVLACSRANTNLSLCRRQVGVGLEVVVKFFERDVHARSKGVIENVIDYALSLCLS